jgi:phage shock protein PspC (stress-responsive transcriptional regulator)
MNNRLYRSPDDRVLAGVAGGMAQAYDMDPALVRLGWALLIVFTGGAFLIIYVIMALVVPLRPFGYAPPPAANGPMDPSAPPPTGPAPMAPPNAMWASQHRRREERGGALIFGVVLILIGGFLLLRQIYPVFDVGRFWPVILVFIGLALLATSFGRRTSA